MEKKKKGRPRKKHHDPVPATFDEVLGAFAQSAYKEKKEVKAKKKK